MEEPIINEDFLFISEMFHKISKGGSDINIKYADIGEIAYINLLNILKKYKSKKWKIING
jgi:hypothetical protein